MPDAPPVLIERHDAIARLTLNRPRAGNAINVEMARALMEAAIACDEDPSIRCVVLTGAGRLFCAGGDVRLFSTAGDQVPCLLKELTSYLHSAVSRLARMEKPLVTAVNGPAAGAGFGLAMLGDIVLASPEATFTSAYGKLGLSPDGGLSWLLPRVAGLRRAQEILLLDPTLSADQARALGLVTRICEADTSLEEQARQVGDTLARSAVGAWGRTRELLLGAYGTSFETHLEAEARAIARGGRSDEGREGISAFTAKIPPDFTKR